MPDVPAALSVDLEFFHHLPAYRGARGEISDTGVGADGVQALLDAFDAAGARGTFFTVGEIAELRPEIVRQVARDGHEIGSHTHTHQHMTELSAADRRSELARSKERLEATATTEVSGFRAPSFDIATDQFDALSDLGYEYDSSVAPCRSIPGWYGGEYEVDRPVPVSSIVPETDSDLVEVPVAVMPGLRLPLTGTWIRFFGVHYTILGMRLLARRGIAPVLYVHPWELVDLPDVEGVPSRVYWRTGAYMRRAVRRILAEPFEFVTVETLVSEREGGRRDAGGAIER